MHLTIKAATCLVIPLALLLLPGAPVFATKSFEPVFNPTLEVSRSQSGIKIDGNIEDSEWSQAGRAANFVERFPGENTAPEVETEAYITYDEDNLYVAFKCYDDPSTIRATMCQRDQFSGDDAVMLMVDTYGDASWAYEFHVNPYGVQKDMLWTNIVGEDQGFDMIWSAAARITDDGYQVEIAVPFASMRFPHQDEQAWKVDFWRQRPRESFKQYSWAANDRNEQCFPCKWGTVTGISGVQPGKGFELLPSMVANQSGSIQEAGTFDNGKVLGEIALGAKYSVSSDITLEGAYNPDFSQIEADADQIDVNTTISLFYPERRPFFQEGSDIFRTLFNSFYTRTVNDPQYAAKMTGRMQRTRIGFISALDENTPYMIPLEEGSLLLNTGKSYVNALRVLRAFGDASQVGAIVTDRRLDGGGSGTIAALDADIRLSRTLSIDGQWIASHTAEPDDSLQTAGLEGIDFDNGRHTAAFDGESYWGSAFITRFKRRARNWNFILNYDQVSPSYRTETGYDPLMNYRNVSLYTSYHFYPTASLFERISPQVYLAKRWGFGGGLRFEDLNVSVDGRIRLAQTYFSVAYHNGAEAYGGITYENQWHVNGNFNTRFSDKIGAGGFARYGKSVARRYATVGNETNVQGYLDLKPIDRLTIEPNFNYLRSTQEVSGQVLYDGYIMRTRFQLQANRQMSMRLVVQYNDFAHTWDVDPLLTYRLSSFSVFYIGSTYDYAEFRILPEDRTDWKMYSRQFFMKLQYLFQT